MASRMVILSRLNTPALRPFGRLSSSCALQLSRRDGVYAVVDQVRREHREDREREGDHYQPGAFDLDGFGQDAPVEPDEHPRVEEHHDPAARGGDNDQEERLDTPPYDDRAPDAQDPRDHDVYLALAPEVAAGQVAGL